MTLPDNFNPFKHLQDVYLQVANKRVANFFKDTLVDGVWTPNIGSSRASLRVACTHLDTDSGIMTQMRTWLFLGLLQGAKVFHPEIYGIPVGDFDNQSTIGVPQITLHFYQDSAAAALDGFDPVSGEISMRLTNETTATLTRSELITFATRIKDLFAKPHLFEWHKGTTFYSYVDKALGYRLKILALNETEAKRVIEQVLDIRLHAPDWDNFTIHDPQRNFPTVPGTKQILGKTVKKKRYRPVEVVKFRYATALVENVRVNLVDTTGLRKKPLVAM